MLASFGLSEGGSKKSAVALASAVIKEILGCSEKFVSGLVT